MFFLPLIHTLPQTQNQKSTTKIKNQPQNQQQNQPPEQNRWISDSGSWIGEAIWVGDVDWGSVMWVLIGPSGF